MVDVDMSPRAPRAASRRREAPPKADPDGTYEDGDLAEVMARAVDGDPQAWRSLTERFGGMIMAIARSCRLDDADVAEVHQMTWLRLVENIDRIEQRTRVGAWLATTARRESLRIIRARGRVLFDHDGLLDRPDANAVPLDAGPLADERSEAMRAAFALLPPHCRRLMGILASDDPPSYKEISKRLSMPIGSIGPTRGRCLEHLRRILDEIGADV